MFNSKEDNIAKRYSKKVKDFKRSYNNRLAMSYVPIAAGTATGGTVGGVAGNMIAHGISPKGSIKVGGMRIGTNLIGRVVGGTLGASIGGRVGLPHAQRMASKALIPNKKQVRKLLPRNSAEKRALNKYLQDSNISGIVTGARNLLPRRSDLMNLLPSSGERRAFTSNLKRNSLEYGVKQGINKYTNR